MKQKLPTLRLISLLTLAALHLVVSSPSVSAQAASVSAQPDSPLAISDLKHDWKLSEDGQFHMLELKFTLKNSGAKAIRAYAINVTEGDPQSRSGSLQSSNITAPKNFIQPGQTRREDVSGHGYGEMPPTVTLAVDFVEFADGSAWGADLHKSADSLAGQRAGWKAELARLRLLDQDYGPEVMLGAVSEEGAEGIAPAGKTEQWSKGYKTGVSNVRGRVRSKYKEGGADAARTMLMNLYETMVDQ